jgi:signal peptidase I
VDFDQQHPTALEGKIIPWQPPPDARWLAPATSDVSVREVSYGNKSIGHELIEAVLLSLVIFLFVQSLVQNRKVVGESMEPSLHNDEHLLIDRATYFQYDANALPRLLGQSGAPTHEEFLLGGPHRGDVVVFRPPVGNEDYIKRVIGLPGEQVQVKAYDGVYVNGRKLNEPYVKDTADYSWPPPGQSGIVPAGHIFVLGDNRRNSSDSHAWGFLALDSVIGRAWVSYWPREVWGFLSQPTYAGLGASR